MASTKREHPEQDDQELEVKKAKLIVSDTQKSESKQRVELNPADCNLDFDVEEKGLQGRALYEKGFAYCWSGARANVGINGGKYCFGCKVVAVQPVEMEDTSPDQQHVSRVGVSRGDDTVGNLGETLHSFGFGGTGKFSNAGKFLDYGEKFGVGDLIVCAVDLERKPLASVGFSKNGKWLGIAKEFDAGKNGLGIVDSPVNELQWESALFPHVLLKNVVVKVHFSVEDGLVPVEGYKPWNCAIEDGNAIMGPTFAVTKDCEIMMMVGLPASGKTTWAEKWVKDHPEKRYILLGTNLALDQMKVPGLLRKQNYGERFDRLMDRATGIFNTLLARAAKTPRNFIIDQTNVYKSARKRKLRPFSSYRKIAVVVFPSPDELKLRGQYRFKEMGKEVPAEAVNEMLANYVLPKSKDMLSSDEHFDEVMFTELNRADAQRHLEEMKRALGPASNSPYSRENSVKSFASPSPQSRGTPAATGGHRQNSYSPLPSLAYDHPRPQRVSSTYSSGGLQGLPQYVSPGYQYGSGGDSFGKYGGFNQNRGLNSESRSPVPGSSTGLYHNYGVDSYGTPNFGTGGFLPAGTDPYQSHGGPSPYGASHFDSRTPVPGRGTNPHWAHGGIDVHSRPDFERATSLVSDFGGPRNSFSYSHLEDPRYAPQVRREPAFNPHEPLPTSYGAGYGTPRAHESQGFYNTPPGPRYY